MVGSRSLSFWARGREQQLEVMGDSAPASTAEIQTHAEICSTYDSQKNLLQAKLQLVERESSISYIAVYSSHAPSSIVTYSSAISLTLNFRMSSCFSHEAIFFLLFSPLNLHFNA